MERVLVNIQNSSLLLYVTLLLFASHTLMQVAALRTPQFLTRRQFATYMFRKRQAETSEQHLVLVGGGHAHLQVIKALNWASRPSNLRVTLIDQQKAASYSGMVPGCISKLYTPEDTLIQLEPLAEWAGIDFINDCVDDIDLQKRVVSLGGKDKRKVPFDCISIDIGSASRGLDETAGARDYSIPTRPISKLVEKIDDAEKEMLSRLSQGESIEPEVVVLGGGAAGIELSLSIMGRWKPLFENLKVTLIDSGAELVPHEPCPSRQSLYRVLGERGIKVQSKSIVQEIKANSIDLLVDGVEKESISYTNCIWATGAGAHPLACKLKSNGLDVTEHGWIKVNEHLQSTSHPFVFAAGDCCSIQNLALGPPPKAGVYAVRAGPVLIENLTKYLGPAKNKESLIKYVPQSEFLRLVCCGDGTALGFRFGKAMHGAWVWQMKDRIDRNFMDLFERNNLPILKEGAAYDTSQYDAKAVVASEDSVKPYRAASMLFENRGDVDYEEAWGVLRYMAQNEEYREEVLKFHDEFAEVLK